jgi:mitochondrial chaperone BCS1
MDFRRLSRVFPPIEHGNNTKPLNMTELQPNLLDSLIPGYSLISQYAQATFGIDISLFVTLGLLIIAGTKGGRYIFEQAEAIFRYLFMSSVFIDDNDDIFDMIMSWLDARDSSKYHRSVTAKTQYGSQWDEDTNDSAADGALDSRSGLFDYNKWAARTPPRYEPYYGRHLIWHEGRLIIFKRSRKPAQQTVQVSWGRDDKDDILQLDCIGRTTQPIKDLIRGIKSWSLDKKRNTTTIRHPTPKDRARYAGAWSKTSSRPSRPMETVILDAEQKSMIVNDMNEYLHPASPKWYATRGIPYRRGYLFHGPPGTGKTSLSFALAGIFGLEIYAISLVDPTLTEGDLMQLFNGLPRRCIVLLEDVDAAGLIRDGNSDSVDTKKVKGKKDGDTVKTKKDNANENANPPKPKKDEDYTLKDLALELKSLASSTPPTSSPRTRRSTTTNPNKDPAAGGISLSGLLNAIDGVATHEGRVLIMTTNHPDELDAALVRPGRVDRRVGFQLAMAQQVEELFMRMYAGSSDGTSSSASKGIEGGIGLEAAELEGLAREFASKIPEGVYTPAEIQNHLMRWKEEPRRAVAGVEEWKSEVAAQKAKVEGSKEEGEGEGDVGGGAEGE